MSTPPKSPEHMKCANCMAYKDSLSSGLDGFCVRHAPSTDHNGIGVWPEVTEDDLCLDYVPDLPTYALAQAPTPGPQ